MESLQSETKKQRGVRPVVIVGVVAFVVTCSVIACGRSLAGYTLRDSLNPAVPVLDLHVAYFDLAGKGMGTSGGNVEGAHMSKGGADGSSVETTQCRPVSGGDLKRVEPKENTVAWGEPTPAPCPLKAQWNVYRHPVAASLYIKDGAALTDWYESNESLAQFRDSPLWSGMTDGLSRILKVRGVDLALPTLPLADWSGQFLRPLFKEILKADAEVHYDVAHGAGGVVLSFNKAKTSLVAQALPLLVKYLGVAGYEVEFSTGVTHGALGGANGERERNTIVQVRLQGKKLFILQRGEQVSIGSSLEGLLNVISSLDAEQSEESASASSGSEPTVATTSATTAVLKVRGEAFFDKLLPVLVGKENAPVIVQLALSKEQSHITSATLPAGRYASILADDPFPGVIAAVPKDSMASLITSAKVPVGTPVSEWSFDAASKLAVGGLALVWDISGEDGEFHYGVAVSARSTSGAQLSTNGAEAAEGDDKKIAAYLSNDAVSTSCAGGSVWLGASSDALLSRMRESCNKSSLSFLDIKPREGDVFTKSAISLAVNGRIAVRELYRLGGGATFSSEEGRAAEVEAQKRLLLATDASTEKLPLLVLSEKQPGGEQQGREPQKAGPVLQGYALTGKGV